MARHRGRSGVLFLVGVRLAVPDCVLQGRDLEGVVCVCDLELRGRALPQEPRPVPRAVHGLGATVNRRTFYLDLIEHTAWTGIQTFAATLVASGLDVGPVTDLSIGQKAVVALLAGAVAVQVARREPASLDRRGQRVDSPSRGRFAGGVIR
jgi:hypothetical protein